MWGIEVEAGGRLTLERASFVEILDRGIHSTGQSLVNVRDVSIRGLHGRQPDLESSATAIFVSGHGSFERVRVEDAPIGVNAAAGGDKRLSLSDLELLSTEHALTGGASGGITRVRVRDSDQALEVTQSKGNFGELDVEDARVGLFFANGADVAIERFRLRAIREAGVLIREDGAAGLPKVLLRDGSLEGVVRPFDAPEGYDLTPLTERVRLTP